MQKETKMQQSVTFENPEKLNSNVALVGSNFPSQADLGETRKKG